MARPTGLQQTDEAKERISQSQKLRYAQMRESMDEKMRKKLLDKDVSDKDVTDLARLQNRISRGFAIVSQALIEMTRLFSAKGNKDNHLRLPLPTMREGRNVINISENDLHEVLKYSVSKVLKEYE